MKKLLVVILMLAAMGCAGLNTSVPVNIATDIAFTMILKNNPLHKPAVVNALNAIKTALGGEVTYDDLIVLISQKLPGEYAYIAVILTAYIDTDKPIFETYLPMFAEYKAGVIAKLDRLILLASI